MGWLATSSRLSDFSHKIARQWINYPYFLYDYKDRKDFLETLRRTKERY